MAIVNAKILILDGNDNVSYQGSSNGVFVWGTQLEFESYFESARQNYNNIRYMRTTGNQQSFLGSRFLLDNTYDSTPVVDAAHILKAISLGNFTNGAVKDKTDINNMYNQGLIVMTNYMSDLSYMASDYVGSSRVFTY